MSVASYDVTDIVKHQCYCKKKTIVALVYNNFISINSLQFEQNPKFAVAQSIAIPTFNSAPM